MQDSWLDMSAILKRIATYSNSLVVANTNRCCDTLSIVNIPAIMRN